MVQLDAAAMGTYCHNKDLDTVDRLITSYLQLINEVTKHLRNNLNNFFDQLKELEEHICLRFNAVI